jgi:hypothetical protein
MVFPPASYETYEVLHDIKWLKHRLKKKKMRTYVSAPQLPPNGAPFTKHVEFKQIEL